LLLKRIKAFIFVDNSAVTSTMAEEGEKKEAESKKHTYPLIRVSDYVRRERARR
jgi:hypothetical protein